MKLHDLSAYQAPPKSPSASVEAMAPARAKLQAKATRVKRPEQAQGMRPGL